MGEAGGRRGGVFSPSSIQAVSTGSLTMRRDVDEGETVSLSVDN